MMTCSLCETGQNFRRHIIPPRLSPGKFLGDLGKIIIFCPPNKKIVFGRFLGEINFCRSPEHRNLCLGDFQGKLISVSPPNIEIGVRGDLDYSPGQSLLVRRDLTQNPRTRCVIYFGPKTSPGSPKNLPAGVQGSVTFLSYLHIT